MSDLIDVWFTQEQLKTILHSLQEYYHYCIPKDQAKLLPILEHMEHCLQRKNQDTNV